MSSGDLPREVGRYLLFDVIASGGMASIHLGRLRGAAGFNKTVAVKRLHPHLLQDRHFVTSFIDEARIAARIQHPNAVAVLDVLESGTELLLVMEYVPGLSLSRLLRAAATRSKRAPVSVLIAIIAGALHGLHAAHEATDELGEPLHIIHRDVSPQNILVGVDGTARILDFGIAKARGRLTGTGAGVLKGKLGYMAPEQLVGAELSRASDIYAMGVVLWEGLTGRRFVEGETEALQALHALQNGMTRPSETVPSLPPSIDELVLHACHKQPAERFATAREMALALSSIPGIPAASTTEVGEWASRLVYEDLSKRASVVRKVEAESNRDVAGVEIMLESETATVATPTSVRSYGGPVFHSPPPPRAYVPDSIGTPGPAVVPVQQTGRRGTVLFASIAVLTTMIALAIAFIVARKTPLANIPAATELPSTTAVEVRVPASASASAVASASATSSATAAATATVAASVGTVVVVPPARKATVTRPQATPTAPHGSGVPPKVCDPPFVLDPDGTRHWKRECL